MTCKLFLDLLSVLGLNQNSGFGRLLLHTPEYISQGSQHLHWSTNFGRPQAMTQRSLLYKATSGNRSKQISEETPKRHKLKQPLR